ncbi:adenylate/guanylate cyclase domain-containing protein [Bacteroidota bacterium]
MEDRRHIAVMFTDIVGYTALMGSDEDKAFDMLKRNHTIHATQIKKHNGKLIKEVGDGTLASFPLASDAVRCAMDIQKEAKSQKIPLKIGIHQGEMVMVGADVLGDAVNVASRLQESAEEGCICISGAVQRDVKNKAGITAEFQEEKTLKNVDDPIKVYEVVYKEEVVEEKSTQDKKSKKAGFRLLYYIIAGLGIIGLIFWLSRTIWSDTAELLPTSVRNEKVAVAVFNNYTNDLDLDALGYMASDWITSGLRELQVEVSSPEMMSKYQDNVGVLPDNPQNEASLYELTNARYVVTGSYYLKGDSLQMTSRLESTESGEIIYDFPAIWGRKTEKELLIEEIREKLKGYWAVKEDQSLSKLHPPKYQAYQAFLACASWAIDLDCYLKVLEIDSTFLLARIYLMNATVVYENEEIYRSSRKYVLDHWEKCTDFGKNLFNYSEFRRKQNYEEAANAIEKNLELDPKDLAMLHTAGYFRSFLNYTEKSVEIYQTIFDNFDIYQDKILGVSYYHYFDVLNRLGRQDEVIDFALEQPIEILNDMGYYGRPEIVRSLLLEKDFDRIPLFLDKLHKNGIWISYMYFAYIYNNTFPTDSVNLFGPELRERLKDYNTPENVINPLQLNAWSSKAFGFYNLKEWEKAESLLVNLQEADGEGRWSWYRKPWQTGFLGCVYARQEKKEEAFMQIQKLEALRAEFPEITNIHHRGIISYWQARIYAILNEKDKAVSSLKKSLEEGKGFQYQHYVFDWDLASLSGYPPYESLISPK